MQTGGGQTKDVWLGGGGSAEERGDGLHGRGVGGTGASVLLPSERSTDHSVWLEAGTSDGPQLEEECDTCHHICM